LEGPGLELEVSQPHRDDLPLSMAGRGVLRDVVGRGGGWWGVGWCVRVSRDEVGCGGMWWDVEGCGGIKARR
jgi:hypothetical protein